MNDYRELNRASWDARAPAHAASADYAVQRFVDDPEFISGVVAFDVPRLGDVSGLDVVHLQCHIGTDTLSLARLGARVTGLDFSPASVAQARALAERTATLATFVEADVYDAVDVLGAVDDPRPDGLLAVEHPYFERPEPSVWDEGGTYVQTDAVFTANTTHEWNHGLGEIVSALLDNGMELTALVAAW